MRVGYKNQSAIGNLENRAGGTGGTKIGLIADVLCVPVDWLLRGPDSLDVPYFPVHQDRTATPDNTIATDREAPKYHADPLVQEAATLLLKMSPAGREQALAYLRFMATQHAAQPPSSGGERDSIPHQKAA